MATLNDISPKFEKAFAAFQATCLRNASRGADDGEAEYHFRSRILGVLKTGLRSNYDRLCNADRWELYDVSGASATAKTLTNKLKKAEDIVLEMNVIQKEALKKYLENY